MAAAEETPPISRRIRETREHQFDENGRKLSQEKVAQRLGLSLKAYRAYETFREPNAQRLRQIARALGQPDDYFAHSEITEEVRQVVREELSELVSALRRLEARLEGEAPPREPDGPS
jgi:transcriptional regulator with XRE-family HTH domain